MTKEFRALERMENILRANCHHYKQDVGYIREALQHLEQIENAEPNEALKCLKTIKGEQERYSLPYDEEIKIIEQTLLKAQEQERKLDRVEELTFLLFSKRRKIGQEYIKWCEENNAKFDDETNMATWFLSTKLREVLNNE